MYADYQCKECEHTWTYKKPYGENWPKGLECPECQKKKGYKLFHAVVFDVGEGMAGNSKTGYSTSVNYKVSKFHPNSKKITGIDSLYGGGVNK